MQPLAVPVLRSVHCLTAPAQLQQQPLLEVMIISGQLDGLGAQQERAAAA